jgi:DNA modification methylase
MSTVSLFQELPTGPSPWRGESAAAVKWSVYEGDALEVLKSFPDNSFNCCITSPPYYWLRDYGVENQIGLETTVTEYVQAIAGVMSEVHRILKDDGLLFLNLGDTYYSGKGQSQGFDQKSSKRRFGLRAVDKSGGLGLGIQRKSLIGIPWRVAIEMSSNQRWVLRSNIIWHRQNCLPESVQDRPRRNYEYVFMFAKDRKYYFNREPLLAKNIDEDVWTIPARPRQANGLDTAPYPEELVERCLEIGCPEGGSVLDPFAGSGTTLRVALKSGRPTTGVELNPIFCQYIIRELGKI